MTEQEKLNRRVDLDMYRRRKVSEQTGIVNEYFKDKHEDDLRDFVFKYRNHSFCYRIFKGEWEDLVDGLFIKYMMYVNMQSVDSKLEDTLFPAPSLSNFMKIYLLTPEQRKFEPDAEKVAV